MLNAFTFAPHPPPVIDTRRVNAARVWNYWLGGKDILAHAAGTLDFTRPVALLLQILNHTVEDEAALATVTRLLDALPAGSYLLVSHPTAHRHRAAMLAYTRLWNEHITPSVTTRSPQQLTRFFDAVELLEPGVVSCSLWRPDPSQLSTPVAADALGGVGRKATNDATRGSVEWVT